MRIREFSSGAHRKCCLSATAARYLWRDDGFHLSGEQVWSWDLSGGMAECSAYVGMASTELAPSRPGDMGGKRWTKRVPALTGNVLGCIRPGIAVGAEALASGTLGCMAAHTRRDLQ